MLFINQTGRVSLRCAETLCAKLIRSMITRFHTDDGNVFMSDDLVATMAYGILGVVYGWCCCPHDRTDEAGRRSNHGGMTEELFARARVRKSFSGTIDSA